MDFKLQNYETFPGWELVGPGLKDLNCRQLTKEALLVLIGGARLRRLGFNIPVPEGVSSSYEHLLYSLIESERGDGAHSFYNSLIRRLVSFERSAENANAHTLSTPRIGALNTKDN